MNRAVILFVCLLPYFANASNILGFFPISANSHYIFVEPLLSRLADRGHNVTIYTVFPHRNTSKYHEIDIKSCMPKVDMSKTPIDKMFKQEKLFNMLRAFLNVIPTPAEILQCEPLVQLLNSTDKFDLFLTDIAHSDWYVGFAYKFRVPMINIYPNIPLPWFAYDFGATVHSAYIPCYLSADVTPRMNFKERLYNTVGLLIALTVGRYYTTVPSNNVAKAVFGDIPSLIEIVQNTSITFVNKQPYQISYPMPPNLINVAGLNIEKVKKLPENIEKFINESEHGVVYFCMGSLLKGETFLPEKREAFLHAFSKIPQRVLWKWEAETLEGKSDKILISKWMPQRDILAHPKVKLFISHGGLLGTSEAIYEGVPILGIPIFGDQRANIESLEANGAAELLNYDDISKEVVLEKIQKLLNDPKYKINAKQLSERCRDTPMPPLDTAVYWTEYVIRHKGAPHLRTASANLSLYQYLLLDVIAFLIAGCIMGVMVTYYGIKFFLKFIHRLICKSEKCSLKSQEKVKSN